MYDLNTKYYLPLSSAIGSMLSFGSLRRSTKDPERKYDYARREFFGLAFACRRMRYVADEVGGLFFKDLTGERIIGRCWRSFLKSFTDNFQDDYFRLLARITSPIKLDETGDAFLSRMDAKKPDGSFTEEAAPLQEGWQRFQAWIDSEDYPSAIERLEALRQVLGFEMNRPFLYWYERVDPIPQNDRTKKVFLDVLQEFDGTTEEKAASAKHLDEYLDQACRESQVSRQP